ncbi:MAG TPA: hypothetical protein VHX61_10000 [Rhizomicrobium sp.]|jgi:hypothetical protein|nr:hypothetical protein [Rhizomicrobium sp.]
MKILSAILVAIAVAVAWWDASAQTPPDAVGVPIVGTPPCGSTTLRCSNLTGYPYVLLGGYYNQGDGAGGYLAMGKPGCTDNSGTVFKDVAGNCFYRMDDRPAIPVNWFGAKCDGTTTPVGGSIAAGSTTFTSTSVTFQPGDVGKVIQFDYQAGVPFRTTISAYLGASQVTLANAPATAWPGQVGATSANFNPQNGLDSPGASYAPQDVLTVQGGSFSSPATATVRATGLVGFGSTTGGTGYAVGDSIYFIALPAAGYTTVDAAEIQVQSVDPGTGAVTGYTFVSNGDFRPISSSTTTNPLTFAISTSGGGSGFSVSLAPGNASFGVAEVYKAPTSSGQYAPTPAGLPPIPSSTSGSGTGATITLAFEMPTFTYATDDTGALQALETWMETESSLGMYPAAEVPGGHTCLLQTLEIQRPVTWRSSGSRQARLMQVMGSQGSTVDGTNYAFILVAASSSAAGPYQDASAGAGEIQVGLNNLSIIGATKAGSVVVDGTSTAYANAGLLFEDPTGTAPNVRGALETLQVKNFPGNALAANSFSGELRGYNVAAGSSAGNCVDLEHTANPYRFYGLAASGCTIGINLVKTKSEEFHGVSAFDNTVDVSVTGSHALAEAYVLFDGAQFGHAVHENMYLDQQNETVLCAANCVLTGAWDNGCATAQTPACVAVEIGPDARIKATGLTPIIAQFNQGVFEAGVPYDVYFDTGANGKTCNCRVALGGGMVDVAAPSGIPTTNVPSQLTGQTTYAPPVFANAASVGVPLSLGPAELGIGLSRDVESQPNGAGVKLRVECGTKQGTAKIVALAGTSSAPFTVLDDIGSGVGGCQ